jgi:hypothetical protein
VWGAPDSPPARCIGCGAVGLQWVERRRLEGWPVEVLWRLEAGELGGGRWARICPACYGRGWRLTEPKELGQWWSWRYGAA